MATLAELLSTHYGKHVLPALQRTVLLSAGFVLNIQHQTLFSWCTLASLGYVQLLLCQSLRTRRVEALRSCTDD